MTNYEKIKQMSVQEMAAFLGLGDDCYVCVISDEIDETNRYDDKYPCHKCAKNWLESEVKK